MARWNDEDAGGTTTFLLGALAGALVGAGIALLTAPKSGAQTRQDLSAGYNSMRDTASRRYRDLADRATQKFEQKVDQYAGRTSSMGDASGMPHA